MIVWLASFPKSGNTYLRSFLSSYYFSDDGKFDFKYLSNIRQFPNIKFSKFKIASFGGKENLTEFEARLSYPIALTT